MEYTLLELKELLNYMDAQLKDQEPYFDGRLLSRRANVAQAVRSLEKSEQFRADLNSTRQEHKEGESWGSI
jgi:hypothetical protein